MRSARFRTVLSTRDVIEEHCDPLHDFCRRSIEFSETRTAFLFFSSKSADLKGIHAASCSAEEVFPNLYLSTSKDTVHPNFLILSTY